MKITFSPNLNLPFVFSGLSTAADCEHMYSVLNVNPKPVNSGKKANGMGDGKEVRFFFFTVAKRIWEDETFCAALFFFFLFFDCQSSLTFLPPYYKL